jgi:hypothetical protein
MYYIFERHYKEFHLGVLFHMAVIGEGDCRQMANCRLQQEKTPIPRVIDARV